MINEFALEPALLSNWKDFRYLVEKFGVHKGRLISRYPKNWKKLVYQALTGCDDIERARIVEKLTTIDDKLLARVNEWDQARSWLDNAILENQSRPFRAILAQENPNNVGHVLVADELDETNPLWADSTHCAVRRTPHDLAVAFAPLLKASARIAFIDPHFKPEMSRYYRPLREYIRVACTERLRPVERIEFHLKCVGTADFFQSELDRNLRNYLPAGLAIEFRRLRERQGGEKLHARYVLTERGGLKVEVGLDSGSAGETTPVDCMTEIEYRKVWSDFLAEETAFDLVDRFYLEGRF